MERDGIMNLLTGIWADIKEIIKGENKMEKKPNKKYMVMSKFKSSDRFNLEKQFVKSSKSYSFEIDEFKKSSLLNGLDEIGLTLENKSVIANFEKSYFSNYPWLKQE